MMNSNISELLARRGITAMERGECEIHGPFSAFRVGGDLHCPHCVLEAADLEYQRRSNDRLVSDRGQQTFWNVCKRQHVPPPRFVNSTFSAFIAQTPLQQAVLDFATTYAESFDIGHHSLLMVGTPGTGKTHLGIAMVRRLAERGFRAAYITIFDLLTLAQNPSRSDRPIIEDLNTYHLVVLDEVGAHGDFGWNQELVISTVFQLIDARYSNKLTTAIISNLRPDELEASVNGLGTRVMDRLKDARQLPFDWESNRG